MSDPQRLDLSGIDLSGRTVGCIGADPDAGWQDFPGIVFEQRDRVDFARMQDVRLEVVERLDGPFGAMIVSLGRSRAANLGRIARALRLLGPDGRLIVTGQKVAGVDSLLKQVRGVLPVGEVLSKAHGKLFEVEVTDGAVTATEAWHEAAQPAPIDGGWITAPGMFSADAPDPGSVLLAGQFDGRIRGHVADLGAGWGWLAAALLAAAPEITTLDLHEADADALDAARRNVTDPRARFHWSDVTALPASRDHDWVVSNPPFHHGRAADPVLGRRFIERAAGLLKPSGKALFVANRQLPYEAQLTEAFKHWEELPGTGAFKLFAAERPKKR